jgi:hypothetical protein
MNSTLASYASAAVLPAAICFFFFGYSSGWSHAFVLAFGLLIIASLHVLVLFLPGMVLLYKKRWLRRWSVLALGFLAGCLPMAILLWPPRHLPLVTSRTIDGNWITAQSVPTLSDWQAYGNLVLFLGACGISGAIAFVITSYAFMRSNQRLERP